MAAPNPSPFEATNTVTTVSTAELEPAPAVAAPVVADPSAVPDALYPEGTPDPRGTAPGEEARAYAGESTDPTAGVGVDGEVIVWEARYSKRNFIGRIAWRVVLTIAWIALAVNTWGMGHESRATLTWIVGGIVALTWVTLAFRMIQAHFGHYYRLTNRRLFVSTGVIHRRRDMMELLRVKDVFTRQQTLLDRWISLGSVVVVPSEKELPTFYLTGVDDPKQVMDLIWHHARAERDQRSVKVDRV